MAEPDEPAALLPEGSLLSLDSYLEMQRAIGNETRFRLPDRLVTEGIPDHGVRELMREEWALLEAYAE